MHTKFFASEAYQLLSQSQKQEVSSIVDEIVDMFIKKCLNLVQIESVMEYVKAEIKQFKISK